MDLAWNALQCSNKLLPIKNIFKATKESDMFPRSDQIEWNIKNMQYLNLLNLCGQNSFISENSIKYLAFVIEK